MTGRELLIPLALSLSIHITLIPAFSSLFKRNLPMPAPLPVWLVESVQEIDKPEPVPPEPQSKPKVEKLTAPRLLSKPQPFSRQTSPLTNKPEAERKEPEKSKEEKAGANDLSGAPAVGESQGSASGGTAEGGSLFTGAPDVPGGLATPGPHGAKAASADATNAQPSITGEGAGSGKTGSTIARPLEGYQFKPHYPESARRARAEGTTLLKFQVLATGRVGEILIEKSAGRRDLDEAAAEAVKRWRFEPARMGKEPVAVWVTLPIEFKLYAQ
jgi:periplasmic protein TonB